MGGDEAAVGCSQLLWDGSAGPGAAPCPGGHGHTALPCSAHGLAASPEANTAAASQWAPGVLFSADGQ